MGKHKEGNQVDRRTFLTVSGAAVAVSALPVKASSVWVHPVGGNGKKIPWDTLTTNQAGMRRIAAGQMGLQLRKNPFEEKPFRLVGPDGKVVAKFLAPDEVDEFLGYTPDKSLPLVAGLVKVS